MRVNHAFHTSQPSSDSNEVKARQRDTQGGEFEIQFKGSTASDLSTETKPLFSNHIVYGHVDDCHKYYWGQNDYMPKKLF